MKDPEKLARAQEAMRRRVQQPQPNRGAHHNAAPDQVYKLAWEGLSDQAIAQRLGISRRTLARYYKLLTHDARLARRESDQLQLECAVALEAEVSRVEFARLPAPTRVALCQVQAEYLEQQRRIAQCLEIKLRVRKKSKARIKLLLAIALSDKRPATLRGVRESAATWELVREAQLAFLHAEMVALKKVAIVKFGESGENSAT